MAQVKFINLYPSPRHIDIGNFIDNDKSVQEPIDAIFVENAYIGYYGYITKKFKNIEHIVSPRHRNTIPFKSIISTYILKKKIKISEPAISIMNGWYENFYHFSLECLVKIYILRNYNGTIVFPSKLHGFHKEWIAIFGLKNITYIEENEVVETPLAISSNFPNRDLNHHANILPEFRDWILSKVSSKNVLICNKIFVGRRTASKRNLTNQQELKIELAALGFFYIEMEDFSVEEQINIFRHADYIVGVHGASLSHLMFCKPNTKVIDLIHEEYHVFCFLKLSKILNINYDLIFCKGELTDKTQSGYTDFYAEIELIKNKVKKW
jgi:hypothetical protein